VTALYLDRGRWLYVSEATLRSMCRALRADTGKLAAGLADPAAVAKLAAEVALARHTCTFTEGGMWGYAHRPSHRRFLRTMEDAKQTVRKAEIELARVPVWVTAAWSGVS
jgi:hypothetical protein